MHGPGLDNDSSRLSAPAAGDDGVELCRRCAAGDESAFSDIYRLFGRKLYGAAWRILKSPQEAEEVVQEAFLTLYRKLPEAAPDNLGGWLHRVTVNRSLDRIRRRQRRGEVGLYEEVLASPEAPAQAAAPAQATTGPAAAGSVLAIDLQRAVDELPERARMVFLLHDVEGFKHREIGELMGISDGSSKSQLFRARRLLRARLQAGDGDDA